jgi:hypothetical protein
MLLKLRPTGLGSGIDKDRPDYTVYTGEWEVGRIYQTRGGPDSLRWFWSMTVNGPMTRSDRVATLCQCRGSAFRPGRWSRGDDVPPPQSILPYPMTIRRQTAGKPSRFPSLKFVTESGSYGRLAKFPINECREHARGHMVEVVAVERP